MGIRDMQLARAAQVSLLMRSYRESFSPIGGRRGLMQKAPLERTGSVDSPLRGAAQLRHRLEMEIRRHPPHSPVTQQSELV